MELKGRAAIITGANQGLGKAIATHYVQAGASVLLVARGAAMLTQVEAELRALAPLSEQVIASYSADISHPESGPSILAEAQKHFPAVTILVNNAGVYGPMGLIEEVDWAEWVQAVQINLFGTVQMCRAVIPTMRKQQYGKIINLSGGGATAPLPRITAYAASKVAIVRLTETFAEELREAHVDVNAIAPGALNTRMLDQVLSAGPEKVGKSFYERARKQEAQGGASLDQGASLAVFLGSAASDGISGRLLSAQWDDWAKLAGEKEHLARTDIFTLRRIVPEDRRAA